MQSGLRQKIDRLVRDIWKDEMKKDYEDCFFWEESVLKNAFYHHLRNGIKRDKTLNDLVLYPEMRVKSPEGEKLRIDIAIVEVPECGVKTWEECNEHWEKQGSCISNLLAAFEFKHWDRIYPRPLELALNKFQKHFEKEGVYYADDKVKKGKLLFADILYFGAVLDDKRDRLPTREEFIRKLNSPMSLQLLIGSNVQEKIRFECL